MTTTTGTWIGALLLGALVVSAGILSRRHTDALVGTLGGEELLERRRNAVRRGATAFLAAGSFLVLGGIALAARQILA